jgi:hypothetical protein
MTCKKQFIPSLSVANQIEQSPQAVGEPNERALLNTPIGFGQCNNKQYTFLNALPIMM